MHFLVCSPDQSRSLRFLQATASLSTDAVALEYFHSLESFFERLRKPIPPNAAAVIVAGNAGDLRNLLPKNDFLWNLRVIVALPDDSRESLVLARTFRPRYIASGKSDFSDVAAVLKKMAGERKGFGTRRKKTIAAGEGRQDRAKQACGRLMNRGDGGSVGKFSVCRRHASSLKRRWGAPTV
jgi:hypothetical protein